MGNTHPTVFLSGIIIFITNTRNHGKSTEVPHHLRGLNQNRSPFTLGCNIEVMASTRKNRGIKRSPEDLRIIKLERELKITLQRLAELERIAVSTEYWLKAEQKHEERMK